MRTHAKREVQPSRTRTVPGTTPFQLQRILVPVDLLESSERALEYAIPFARLFKAQMIFLHVIALHYSSAWAFEMESYDALAEGDLCARRKKQLSELVHKHLPARLSSRIELRHGSPSIEIINAAKEWNADLIIMSTHGRTGRVHAFVGSVAADVTRMAPCPVLVVRQRERDFTSLRKPRLPAIPGFSGVEGAPPA